MKLIIRIKLKANNFKFDLKNEENDFLIANKLWKLNFPVQ